MTKTFIIMIYCAAMKMGHINSQSMIAYLRLSIQVIKQKEIKLKLPKYKIFIKKKSKT